MAKTSNKLVNPNAREAMNRFKMEAANEVGVNLKQGYNGDLTSKQAGSVGGQMVRKMIQAYENGMQYTLTAFSNRKSSRPTQAGAFSYPGRAQRRSIKST